MEIRTFFCVWTGCNPISNENFSIQYPANVVRYDLESYISGHRGVFFQDRKRFPSTI